MFEFPFQWAHAQPFQIPYSRVQVNIMFILIQLINFLQIIFLSSCLPQEQIWKWYSWEWWLHIKVNFFAQILTHESQVLCDWSHTTQKLNNDTWIECISGKNLLTNNPLYFQISLFQCQIFSLRGSIIPDQSPMRTKNSLLSFLIFIIFSIWLSDIRDLHNNNLEKFWNYFFPLSSLPGLEK